MEFTRGRLLVFNIDNELYMEINGTLIFKPMSTIVLFKILSITIKSQSETYCSKLTRKHGPDRP